MVFGEGLLLAGSVQLKTWEHEFTNVVHFLTPQKNKCSFSNDAAGSMTFKKYNVISTDREDTGTYHVFKHR